MSRWKFHKHELEHLYNIYVEIKHYNSLTYLLYWQKNTTLQSTKISMLIHKVKKKSLHNSGLTKPELDVAGYVTAKDPTIIVSLSFMRTTWWISIRKQIHVHKFLMQACNVLEFMVLRSVFFMVKFRFFIPELWDFIHQIVGDFSYVALWIENPLAKFTSSQFTARHTKNRLQFDE
jgi:hypothetical protein